ncbi:ABC transporter ATP-binding protein [Nocardioides sp. HDW12B]|uniref:ABC transporter ATP-binding protein n=1 Tax=Nocardioides sp. HDW12B TaxID=2714939 RepID=UPI0014092962|nr:ABC transporter ATP-binding protein [Nocardioides sp. HDW12B]QIK67767.1 ABC transporter ATP-binding protein [Nocardioides sp. HDW12B]
MNTTLTRPAPTPVVAEGRLRAERLTLGYGERTVVDAVDLTVPDGKVTVVVGANACGKSTLLRGLARLLRPHDGTALLDGQAVHRLPTREVARRLAVLPQGPVVPDGVTVADLVARGRHPHRGAFRRWGAEDEAAVAEALTLTGTDGLAERVVDELSGGQRQRVWLAVALAQRTDLLLLDEPTTFLDLTHQVEVLDLLLDLNRDRGTTVVMVLHDLTLAARYSDHLVAVRDGRVHAAGPPAEVVTERLVHEVLGLECRVVPDPVTGTPLVVPLGRHHRAGPAHPVPVRPTDTPGGAA